MEKIREELQKFIDNRTKVQIDNDRQIVREYFLKQNKTKEEIYEFWSGISTVTNILHHDNKH